MLAIAYTLFSELVFFGTIEKTMIFVESWLLSWSVLDTWEKLRWFAFAILIKPSCSVMGCFAHIIIRVWKIQQLIYNGTLAHVEFIYRKHHHETQFAEFFCNSDQFYQIDQGLPLFHLLQLQVPRNCKAVFERFKNVLQRLTLFF